MVRLVKRALSKVISQSRPHWQKGFFDHLIRHGESYSEKWEYVRQNPVRAGLVGTPEDWPWQGEIVPINKALTGKRCSGARRGERRSEKQALGTSALQ